MFTNLANDLGGDHLVLPNILGIIRIQERGIPFLSNQYNDAGMYLIGIMGDYNNPTRL
jgi:hypothetical protein